MDNIYRIKNCLRRAADGEELTIGFFGGSITQGSLASSDTRCYAWRVFEWWKNRFPKAVFHYVNGGIGGTSSHYGVSRVMEHLLMYRPDFVVVDFSVNDEASEREFFQETYEGLLRRIWGFESAPAMLVLNNVYYDSGITAQDYHNEFANYYGIPHVSIRDTVYGRMKAGEYTLGQLTPDGLHPNDFGHGLVAREIVDYLERICDSGLDGEETLESLPNPLTKNGYENAMRLTIANCSPTLSGFRVDAREKMGHLDHFKNGWIGRNVGEQIVFSVKAACIAVQYRKTIRRPAPVAELVLDGDSAHPIRLDANFNEDWGDCLYLQPVLHHGSLREHTLEISIVEGGQGMEEDFYILSLVVACF